MRYGILMLLAGLLATTTVAANEDALIIDGKNTVILDRSTYAGRWLQYYLIEAVSKHPDAEQYNPHAKPAPDRAAAPVFALYKNEKNLPQDKNIIAVGTDRSLNEPYLSEADKKQLRKRVGSILVRRTGNVIVIANSGTNPWLFGHLNVFLNKAAGVRLYAPGNNDDANLWLARPKENSFAVNHLDIAQAPYFAKTAFSGAGHKRNAEWQRINTPVSEGNQMRASHTIIHYFPQDKYYESHPQLYPMNEDGTRPKPSRDAWNPCFADPDLSAKIAMQSIREIMGKRQRPYLSFGVMDCAYECKCDVCQKSLKAHNNNAGPLWFEFMNRIAKQCAKEFPDLYLTTYAYSNIDVPSDMKIESNVVVDYVTKSYNFIDPTNLQNLQRDIRKIAQTGASWITHDWDFSGVTPRLYNRQWASFLQWASQNGMKGIYVEWTEGEPWYLDGAKYWILRQLMSDPYQDVDGFWRQYCDDMFGPASEDMYRFYNMFAQKHVYSDNYYRRDDLPRREMAGFTPEDIAQQRAWLEASIELTKNDKHIAPRLTAIMRYFRAHELWALAVGEPARAYHRHTTIGGRSDVNNEALAFYVNDNGKMLLEAVDYYNNKRTIAPDSHKTATALGIDLSYRSNYARALGTILKSIRNQALTGVDVANANAKQVRDITSRAVSIYRDHLPKKYDPKRAEEIESLFRKILWIPRGKEMPKIDGKLDDVAWRNAAQLEDFTLADLILPSQEGNETSGKIMRVGDHLVLALTCEQPKGVWSETTPDIFTGTRIWRESCCEIFFGPQPAANAKPEYFQYIVNSLGAFRGFQTARDNRERVQAAAITAADNKSYTIEVALPLKVEGQYDYTKGKAFNFTIMRQVYNSNTFSPPERLGWHPMFFTAHNTESRGLVLVE